MKKIITFFILLSICILTAGCTSDYKTMSYGNTQFKAPNNSAEETKNGITMMTFPSSGMLGLRIYPTEVDDSLLEYTVNYIHENTGTSDIYSQKSLNYNGTNVVEVKLQYGD